MTELAAEAPDVIVFELGDGLLGAYGVQAILLDSEIRAALSAVVLWLTMPSGEPDPESASLQPWLSPRAAGLRGSF